MRKAGKTTPANKRFDTDKLRNQKDKSTFVIQLRNIFDALTTEPVADDVNILWEKVRDVYDKNSKDCLGYRTNKITKPWLTQTTWKAVEKRRTIKLTELEANLNG